MPGATFAATIAAAALKKPLEDAYNAATGAVKSLVQKWMVSGVRDSIALKIEEVEMVRTIFKSDLVPLSSFYYPSRVRSGGIAGQSWIAATLDELKTTGNILLYGTVGQGKSMFMRNLCVWELREGKRIPIFVELRNIDERNGILDLVQSAMESLGFAGLDNESLDFLLSNVGFSIFLDGFDEIKRQHALSCHQGIQKLIIKYPRTRWVLSSRPGGAAVNLQAIPGITRLTLCELMETDFDPFLARLGSDEGHRRKLLDAIRASSTDVKGVLKTPLMLTLLKETFGVSAHIPDNLHDFYEALFHVLSWRHDDIKDMYQRERATSLSNSELQESFEAFSFLSKEYGVSLTDSQFSKCAKDSAKLVGKSFTPEGLKNDLTTVVCLMAPDGLRTAFIHKSIQEFFAAFFIKDFTDTSLVAQFYRALRQQKLLTWSQEISFLEQLDNDRYVEHFLLPSIDEFLLNIGYSKTSRMKLTKASLYEFLNKLSIIGVQPIASSQSAKTILVISIDSDIFNETTQRFVWHCLPRTEMMLAPKDVIETLITSQEIRRLKFETHFKNNPQVGEGILRRAREFCDRVSREKNKYEKSISLRKNDVAKIFLGSK